MGRAAGRGGREGVRFAEWRFPLGACQELALEIPLAVLWTAKTLYPDLFADIDLAAETKNFYHQFFDCDLSDADVQKIFKRSGNNAEQKSKDTRAEEKDGSQKSE